MMLMAMASFAALHQSGAVNGVPDAEHGGALGASLALMLLAGVLIGDAKVWRR